MKHTAFRRLTALALLVAALCSLCAPALAMREAYTDPILAELRQPMVLGSDTFEYDGVSFHRVLLPRYIVERYDESEYAIQPGQSDARVREVKRALYSDTTYPKNEFVTYTQVRADEPVETYFDDHLAELLSTIYLFCGLEDKTPCIDELTMFLLSQLPTLSEDMRHDIEAMYKYRLTQSRTYGTVTRSGKVDDLYYFAQTDPDWAGEIFEFEGNGATLKDRGCGCACAAMVFSTYHKVEITPRWMRTYALQDDYPVSYGLPNEYFEGIARYYKNLEYERYGTTLEAPTIYQKSAVDMSVLADQIANQGYLAIIHVVSGAFTSQEHYMVLCDYTEIDGKGYFLVADPYVQPGRYRDWDQLRTTDTGNDGLIYATSDVLYRDMKSIILFAQDRNAFPLYCRTDAPESLTAERN